MKLLLSLAVVATTLALSPDPFALYEAKTSDNRATEAISLPNMDIEAEMGLAQAEWDLTKVFVAGKIHNVSANFFDHAQKSTTDEGVLFSVAWKIDNALSLAIHFDRFDVPEGGAVWIIGDSETLGPWTHETKWSRGNLMTPHVLGNQVTVQYFQSYQSLAEKAVASLHVDTVTGRFREFNAGRCNIQGICAQPFVSGTPSTCNPACTPTDRSCSIQCTYLDQGNEKQWAGQDWADEEERGVVVMASAAGSRFCSGSFVNNYAGRPLVLTAAHCRVTGSAVVHKHWRSPSCQSTNNFDGDHVVAGDLVVRAGNGISDMALVEVQDSDLTDKIYLAGWEAGDRPAFGGNPAGPVQPAQSVVALHHPARSNMKISHGAIPVTPTRWSGSGDPTHWRIEYWTEGTTEPGSSGSPMYNQQTKRIIGQLHGGRAACPAHNGFDSYGAVWRSFQDSSDFRQWMVGGDESITGMDGARYNPNTERLA
mmetsp:Transcript_2827/g.3299  ORF Transcript_2827/g.3299 Transcript_2827/m.3299 type:complete len:480 (-) Transcript_2827:95-1534(-)|eukprot:CAMPEP_0205821144 /NCGR_PEP_ID=MMETSP0206-20130828/5198_1 /ASSEMBLY_ACC=CAM_ASM_000279 /TAXON_ID=36767 /ORGANISM="Euplotes focardii, Strain TN1" /LENGTH=479 /DNA_ID=CAMNT_0053116393 /DNA_START=27 /DNA_END=1466 /DNA_ORIENTATION=-